MPTKPLTHEEFIAKYHNPQSYFSYGPGGIYQQPSPEPNSISWGAAWRQYQSSGAYEKAPDVKIGILTPKKSKVTVHEQIGPIFRKGDAKKDAEVGKIAQRPSTSGVATTKSTANPEQVLPLTGAYDPDKRYAGKAPKTHANLPPFPAGSICLLTEATEEHEQNDLLVWCDPRLILANRGPSPLYGSNVCEVDGVGAIETERVARLQTAFRVLRRPIGFLSIEGNRENSLSWTIGLTGKGEAIGGFVTDGPEPLPIHAAVNARLGGPFDVGLENDKFQQGFTKDGRPINSLKFSTTSIFAAPPSWGRDGPLYFQNADWRLDASSGTAPLECYIVWDARTRFQVPRDGGPGAKQVAGVWRILTFTTTYTIDHETPPPPTTTPGGGEPPPITGGGGDAPTTPSGGGGGGPTTGGGDGDTPTATTAGGNNGPYTHDGGNLGGPITPGKGSGATSDGGPTVTGGGNNRKQSLYGSSDTTQYPSIAATITEVMSGPISARPQPIGDGLPDYAHGRRPSEAEFAEYNKQSPATMLATPFGAQSGAEFQYTQRPGESRYPGGTADGGWFYTPPEVGPLDAASGFAPGGVNQSESAHVYGPGVSTVHGTIDPNTGTIDDGVRMRRNSSGSVAIEALVGGAWTQVATYSGDGLRVKSGASAIVESGASASVLSGGSVVLGEGVDVQLGTGTGTKIGTNTSQKLGFFNKSPVVQQATVTAPTGGGTVDTEARSSINEIKAILTALGLTA